jgi:hypothetical protein
MIYRGGINLSRVFFIEAHWNNRAEFFGYLIRRQLRSLIELLFSNYGDEIDIIVYAIMPSAIYSAFRRS